MTHQNNEPSFLRKRIVIIACSLFAVSMVIAIPMLFATLQFHRTTSLVRLPQSEFNPITNEVLEALLKSNSISYSPSSIDIVHMRGSVVMGNLLAIRMHDVHVDATILPKLTSEIFIGKHSLRQDDQYPDWLHSPWTDADGSTASSGAIKRKQGSHDLVIWIWRPAAAELILYCQPLHPDVLPSSVHPYFKSIDYQHETLHGFVGNDWREWRSVRLVPEEDSVNSDG